jgi:hypothetical protein
MGLNVVPPVPVVGSVGPPGPVYPVGPVGPVGCVSAVSPVPPIIGVDSFNDKILNLSNCNLFFFIIDVLEM